jgi:hypothetical protein
MGAVARRLPDVDPETKSASAEVRSLKPRTAHRFRAHARDQGRTFEHAVPGAESLQDAALLFAEIWLAGEAEAGEVSVVVSDLDTGEQSCFAIDLSSGDAEPCG